MIHSDCERARLPSDNRKAKRFTAKLLCVIRWHSYTLSVMDYAGFQNVGCLLEIKYKMLKMVQIVNSVNFMSF